MNVLSWIHHLVKLLFNKYKSICRNAIYEQPLIKVRKTRAKLFQYVQNIFFVFLYFSVHFVLLTYKRHKNMEWNF